MHRFVQEFKMIIIVVGPIKIFLFLGQLPVIELEIYGIQVKVAPAVAGCITGVLLVLFIVLALLLLCAILALSVTAAATTAGFYLLRSSMGKIDQGIYRQHQHTE